ncbi:unnamed protein product [Dicrocoelium dendriticum]|nr:unnamed protein product [Dicrocoelium dendriticum]
MYESEVCKTAPISPRDLPLIELEEQLRFYKEETDRKDKLIRELAKVTALSAQSSDIHGRSGRYTIDKLEEMRVKVDKLQTALAKNKANIVEKDETIGDLRAENESIRLENLTSLSRIDELERLLEEKTAQLSSYSTIQQKNDLILTSLENDLKRKNAKVLELNGKLRDCEAHFKKVTDSLEKSIHSLQNSFIDVARVLQCETTPEKCLLRITELMRSLCNCENKLSQQEDAVKTLEFEERASRETIMRLSGELNHEKREREAACESAKATETELRKLKSAFDETAQRARILEERVNELTLTLHSARQEAEAKENMLTIVGETEAKLKAKRLAREGSENNSSAIAAIDLEDLEALSEFRTNVQNYFNIPKEEKLAGVLSVVCSRIQEMMRNSENLFSKILFLEGRLSEMQQSHTMTVENEQYLKDKIENLEYQHSRDGAAIDRLYGERDHLHQQLCKVALAVGVEETLSEPDPGIFIETVLARVTQLKQGDTERQTQQRLQISRLQRDLREVKDRAEALELQVPIMRRRLIEAQENQTQPFVPASQTPVTLAASEKERVRLAKQLRQTKEESDKLREEIILLKARQLECSQEKLIGVSHQRALRSAQARADELSRACEEHKSKAREVQNELNHCKNEYNSELNRVHEQLGQLERELRSTRQALESSRQSEQELLAFRTLVARQLGLRCENLAVPDYEIIDQLGRLISVNQAQTANLATTESAMNLLGEKH